MVGKYLYRVVESSVEVREVEPPTRQRGASAAGHTPFQSSSRVATLPMATHEVQGLWGLSASTELDRAIVVQPSINCQLLF